MSLNPTKEEATYEVKIWEGQDHILALAIFSIILFSTNEEELAGNISSCSPDHHSLEYCYCRVMRKNCSSVNDKHRGLNMDFESENYYRNIFLPETSVQENMKTFF